MAESFVQVAIDGAGKKIRNFLNNIGGVDVYQQAVTLATSAGVVIDDPARASVTQPVSAASLPLPTGAAQEHTTAASPHAARLTDGAAFYKSTTPADTQPVSAASLPLPTGAAQDATLTGGTTKAIARGGAKGATTAADLTGTAEGADHQAIDVQVYHGGAAKDPTAIRALTSADVVTAAQGTPPWTVKGDQARASATIPNPVVAGLRAAVYPTKPASVAAGQLVDAVADLEGVIIIRPRQLATYTAIYRLALVAASSTLAFTFTANTDKQLATIYHAVGATKRVTLRRVWVQILKTGAVAGELQLELRQLSATTAPATGNPAITPAKRDGALAAAEATCLALPTTAGSEVAANSPTASSILNLAVSLGTASGTGLLPRDPMVITLFDEASADDEEMAPIMRAATAEGWAIIGRSTAAIPLNFIARITFSEE